MDTFNFPYHTFETEYPTEGVQLQYGNSWLFTAGAPSPSQRTFTLNFGGMRYYLNSGGAVDATITPEFNMHALDLFYQAHKLNTPFTYPHPVYGNLTVKFKTPLKIPKGVPRADGLVSAFTVTFIEIP